MAAIKMFSMFERMRKIHLTIFAILIAASCNTENKNKLTTENLKWLNGEWENYNDSSLTFTESWQNINDSLMQGESFTMEKGDTVSHETMQIKISGGKMFFIPTVDNQNNAQTVVFTLEDSKNNSFVFKNRAHDFPQTIVYQKINDDSLAAYIEGTMNGKAQRIDFGFVRKK